MLGYIGVDDDIITHDDLVSDNDSGIKPNTITDGNMTSDNRRRADRKAPAMIKFPADHGAGMDPRWRPGRWMKILQGFGKSHHGIVHLYKIAGPGIDIPGNNYGRGQAIAHFF